MKIELNKPRSTFKMHIVSAFCLILCFFSTIQLSHAQLPGNGPIYVKGSNLGLTVLNQSKKNGTSIILHAGLNHWTMLSNGAIVLKDNPRLGLTVLNQDKRNGAKIILHEGYNLWTVLSNGAIVLKDNHKFGITVLNQDKRNGTQIILHEGYNTWANSIPPPPLPALLSNSSIDVSKTYIIQNPNGLALDIGGGSKSNGGKVQQYPMHKNANQQFKFERYGNGYIIKNVNSGLVLDIPGASMDRGAKIQQWTTHKKDNQQFVVSNAGGGYYYIQNVRSRLVLDVPGGATTSSLQLHQWPLNRSNAQKFRLVPLPPPLPALLPNSSIDVSKTYMIQNVNGLVLDVLMASKSSGAKVQQYAMNKSGAQQFKFERYGSGYIIKNVNSGHALDILKASKSNGAKLQQYNLNRTGAQQFIVSSAGGGYYYIQNVNSRQVLDIPNNASTSGLQLQQWPLNRSNAQKFKLVEISSKSLKMR